MSRPDNASTTEEETQLREQIRDSYADAAVAVMTGKIRAGGSAAAFSPADSVLAEERDPITRDLYGAADTHGMPDDAINAILGCGNPMALADLRPGEVVLDLGSGGGLDVLLSARRVAPGGFAYGLDMTNEMLELARKNQAELGLDNAEFIKGSIEEIPLPDNSVDVVISNCVINLSTDKPRVLREAYRVLRPGGRFAVSDVVWSRPVPQMIQSLAELWVGCVSGALLSHEYQGLLASAGFEDCSLEVTREFTRDDARLVLGKLWDPYLEKVVGEYDGSLVSAFVRASKPAQGSSHG